jgi:hypothetical protein
MFRERRGALPFPASPTEAGAGPGKGKIAQPLCSHRELCRSSRQPSSPKKGIRKFSLGRNRGRRLCSCAHAEQGPRGRVAGGHQLARRGVRAGSHPPGASLLF